MADDFTIVDADAHYLERIDELSTYFDDSDPWKSRFDNVQSTNKLFSSSTGDQNIFGRIQRDDIPEIPFPEEPLRPQDIPVVMAFLEIDHIILLSHRMLSFARMRGDDGRAIALANGYIDYMLDQVIDPDEGIHSMIVVPYQDPEKAVELIDRVGDEPGVAAACMVTAGPEPPLGHHRYDPIYQAAQDHDLPVVFHSGGGGLDEFYIRGYTKFLETHTLGFLWNNMAQLTSLIVQGTPEKFPDLDIVFQESGIFWVPLMIHRLNEEFLKRPSEAPLLTKVPGEYIKEFYFGTQPLETSTDIEQLEWVIDSIGGPDQLMYASDYPHWDYDPPSSITSLPFLSRREKERVLSGTAMEVFDL